MEHDNFEDRRQQKSAIEQHIGTILQVAVVLLLAWSLDTTVKTGKDIEGLKVKVESMQTTLSQGTTDRYRGTDAARDFRAVETEMGRLEKRVGNLESNAAWKK
jgi:hypothetical protein